MAWAWATPKHARNDDDHPDDDDDYHDDDDDNPVLAWFRCREYLPVWPGHVGSADVGRERPPRRFTTTTGESIGTGAALIRSCAGLPLEHARSAGRRAGASAPCRQ